MSSHKKITNPLTGNKINSDGVLARTLVNDGVEFSKKDQRIIKSTSPTKIPNQNSKQKSTSPRRTVLDDIPSHVLMDGLYKNSKGEYTDIKNMSLANKKLYDVGKYIFKNNDVSFDVKDYHKFIKFIHNRTVGKLTMDHKDLLTFYLIERDNQVLHNLGLFTKGCDEARTEFEQQLFEMNEKEGRKYINDYIKDKSNGKKIDEFNKTWEASWSVDFLQNFEQIHYRITSHGDGKELTYLRGLQTEIGNKFMTNGSTKNNPKFETYVMFLKGVPFYERALMNTNDIMSGVDFTDYYNDRREYENAGLYDYRKKKEGDYIRTIPSYVSIKHKSINGKIITKFHIT
jgi:hypothetical protein